MDGGQRGTFHRTKGLIVLGTVLVTASSLVATQLDRNEEPEQTTPVRPFSLDSRPQAGRQLFDYAGNLDHYEEGVQRFLGRMRERFHIEAVIVTLPALPRKTYLEELAVELVDRWRIGGEHEGRGLLLLLVEREKQVKLEVTYVLEHVFTDAFTAYLQDLQLRPYYLEDDIGTGLVAVMEEIENRAQIEQLGTYTPEDVAKLDQERLSGGAGARRSLNRYEEEREATRMAAHGPHPGARSPKEAWEIMLLKWSGEGGDIDVDVYTEITKMAMGDPDHPDPRIVRPLSHWRNAPYEVRQDGDHAVIWFGNRAGWNNAPFLFCRTPTGWKFDIVHQRRLVVMGPSPSWMIEQGDYPYVALLRDAPRSWGKDLPLPSEDRYSCREDAELATQIRALEKARRESPNDTDVLMALLRLNVIAGRRPTYVMPLLALLKTLAPKQPDVYKYAAIYDVHSFFQYETALAEINTYVTLRPNDAFGYSFKGFLQHRLGDSSADGHLPVGAERRVKLREP